MAKYCYVFVSIAELEGWLMGDSSLRIVDEVDEFMICGISYLFSSFVIHLSLASQLLILPTSSHLLRRHNFHWLYSPRSSTHQASTRHLSNEADKLKLVRFCIAEICM